MPGAGRSRSRAAGAGLALPSAPALHQSPQQRLNLHFFCFTQDPVEHWGTDTQPEQCQGPVVPCSGHLFSSNCLSPPHGVCTVPVLQLHWVPHLGLVLVGGEGALCESSPHPVTDYCTFTLTNGAFPKVGMVLEAQLNSRAQPAQSQSSTDPAHPCVGAHWHP